MEKQRNLYERYEVKEDLFGSIEEDANFFEAKQQINQMDDKDFAVYYEAKTELEEYQKRLIKEYQDLRDRTRKLAVIISKYEFDELEFELNCSIELLEMQYNAMFRYLAILEERLRIEIK